MAEIFGTTCILFRLLHYEGSYKIPPSLTAHGNSDVLRILSNARHGPRKTHVPEENDAPI